MHRLPKTSVGLAIRKNRFRAIGDEITEIVGSLIALRRACSRRGTWPGSPDDYDKTIDALAERAAVMRGTSIDAVMSETDDATVKIRSKNATGATRNDVERALAKLERRLRWLIDHTKSDPPTQLLYVQTLTLVERQQWRFEQRATGSSPRSDAAGEETPV